MLFLEDCEQNVLRTISKTLMKMVTLCHICLIFVKSVLNIPIFLCSVFLSPFTNSYKAELIFLSHHLPTSIVNFENFENTEFNV